MGELEMFKKSPKRRGQALIEYALLIVMLLGIFTAGVVVIKQPISSLFCGIGNVIPCDSNSTTPPGGPTPPPGGPTPTADLSTLNVISLNPRISIFQTTNVRTVTYQAEGYDLYFNDLGDVTSSTTFSLDGSGTCVGNVCNINSTTAGLYVVTGTFSGVVGDRSSTANISVISKTLDDPAPPLGGTDRINGAGYCPGTPVQALWSGGPIGDPVNADDNGQVSVSFTVPSDAIIGSTYPVTLQGKTDCGGGSVVDTGPLNLTPRPAPAAGSIVDSFDRPDRSGLGTSDSGYVWNGYGFINNGQGQIGLATDNFGVEDSLDAPYPFPFHASIHLFDAEQASMGFKLNDGWSVKLTVNAGPQIWSSDYSNYQRSIANAYLELSQNNVVVETQTLNAEGFMSSDRSSSLTLTMDITNNSITAGIGLAAVTISEPDGTFSSASTFILGAQTSGGQTSNWDNLSVTP
jgi:hypothetical protein